MNIKKYTSNLYNKKCSLISEKINLEKEIEKTIYELQKFCTHPITKTEVTNTSGGYLDRAERTERKYCIWCDKLVDEKTTYGSFG